MINSISFSEGNNIQVGIKPEDFSKILVDPDALLWVDLSGEPTDEFELILRDLFHFHPLAIEDALLETHIPKADDWDDYIYLVVRGVKISNENPIEIQTPELDVFLGANFLVTYHQTPMNVIDSILQLCIKDQRYLRKGTVNLFYHMVDEMVNQYIPVIELMDGIIDQIEDEVFDKPQPETLNKIFNLKRSLLTLRRTLLPQREVFNKIARGDFGIIQESDRVYFRDVYDHMVRMQEISESLRDLVSGSLDTYLSVVNNRMNDIMKTLTIITVLFMPLTFLTGFFGMNFFQAVFPLEAWTGKSAFLLIIAGLFFIPLIMYVWMRRRDWM